MFTGLIEGVGPRYCPSVEDKVVRFAAKTSHQIFVEPEGLDTHIVYPNGISTSLPADVQLEFVRSIRGFERAEMTPPRLRDRVRLLRSARTLGQPRDEVARGTFLRRADQRHDGLRGGRGPGPARGHQRRARRCRAADLVAAPRRGLSRRARGRSHHARRHRALSHVHEPRGAPAAASRGQCGRTADARRARARSRGRRALEILLREARRR